LKHRQGIALVGSLIARNIVRQSTATGSTEISAARINVCGWGMKNEPAILQIMATWPKEIYRKMPDPRIWPIVSSEISGVQVGGISLLILAANTKRADADFTNDSTCVIYLARGQDAVVGQGIRLNPNGGSYHIGTNNLWEGDVYAIGEAQEKCNIAIIEGNRPG